MQAADLEKHLETHWEKIRAKLAFSCRPILRLHDAADFNRRMRKTARPVVWEVVSRRRKGAVLYER